MTSPWEMFKILCQSLVITTTAWFRTWLSYDTRIMAYIYVCRISYNLSKLYHVQCITLSFTSFSLNFRIFSQTFYLFSQSKLKKKSTHVNIRRPNTFYEIWWMINEFGKLIAIPGDFSLLCTTKLSVSSGHRTTKKDLKSDLKMFETTFHLAIIVF